MTDQLPHQVNQGGLWIFNPPEPRCHPTNVNDIVFVSGHTKPPNHGQIVLPPAVEVTFQGPGREEWTYEDQLVGRHILKLHPIETTAARIGGGYRFSAEYHAPSIDTSTGPFTQKTTPAWSLFFGRANLTSGPYWQPGPGGGVGYTLENAWFLASLFEEDDYGGYVANHVYQFGFPEQDHGETITDDELDPQRHRFDSLGSNRFFVLNWPHDFPENTAVGGHAANIEVSVSPWWP